MFVHSAALPPPCLFLEGPAIYPDLDWSGNISTSPLCWTETDIQPLKALVAFATNLWCKTLKNGVCLKLRRMEWYLYCVCVCEEEKEKL